ncbi:hypothetical protein PISMIDRAFT_19832 [Pisolithus microcarpus 441]|uniref:Uncharacterized protein n=1 Tax=Pisolithus microcarpus 441 TaxID=765257 RepID=A0A0C9YL89_9AGAM|nr:hypothetical protein PISMIDRAFT_19832 [Pisolithus microcarpus 441]
MVQRLEHGLAYIGVDFGIILKNLDETWKSPVSDICLAVTSKTLQSKDRGTSCPRLTEAHPLGHAGQCKSAKESPSTPSAALTGHSDGDRWC